MATGTAKMSLEEFLAVPGDTFHDLHELHTGEVIEVPAPTLEHFQAQERIVELFRARSTDEFHTAREFYFTFAFEARRADVAVISRKRLAGPSASVFSGAPEVVVEILSPSNRYLHVDHLREECFKAGCLRFWVVNVELRTVTDYNFDLVKVYRPGVEPIPLAPFSSLSIDAELIFGL